MLPVRPVRCTGSDTTLPCTVMRVSFMRSTPRLCQRPVLSLDEDHFRRAAASAEARLARLWTTTRSSGEVWTTGSPIGRGRETRRSEVPGTRPEPRELGAPGHGVRRAAPSARSGVEVLPGLSVTGEHLVDGRDDALVGHCR